MRQVLPVGDRCDLTRFSSVGSQPTQTGQDPTEKTTQEKVNKVKTDKIDARRLALNLENGDYVSCHVPDRERREDRQISRTLSHVQRDITRTKNRIRRSKPHRFRQLILQ